MKAANEIFTIDNIGYQYLGNGCKATGAEAGWKMSGNLFFRCAECGYMMNADPNKTDSCTCGKLHKDSDWGRFCSSLGDDAIEVYRKI
jgi:hypothetical protein